MSTYTITTVSAKKRESLVMDVSNADDLISADACGKTFTGATKIKNGYAVIDDEGDLAIFYFDEVENAIQEDS